MSGPLYPGESRAHALTRRFAERTVRQSLRRDLRRAVWVGEAAPATLAPGRPLVLYANHHYYPDSFLLHHLTTRVMRRPMVVWMEAWERAPLFGPAGALPFPSDDGRERARTVRETARRLKRDPRTALILYPEGTMHLPEDGLGPFQADLPRLARLLPPETAWVPVGVRLVWWGESRPTALVAAGSPHEAPDGAERDRLQSVLDRLVSARPADLDAGRAHVILDGAPGPDERWDLSRLAPLFRRITFGG